MREELGAEAVRRCDELGTLSEEAGRLTRTFLSPPVREVQRRVRVWMEAAGMSVRLDAAGNVIGRYAPPGATGPAFLMGSHVDTVRDAGRYDGILGVTLAIAAVDGVRRRGLALPFPLEVLAFSEEEGARFGVPFLGSRAVVGSYDPDLLARRDAQGVSVAEAIRDFGNDPAALPAAEIAAPAAFGYLEAHIEQGPVLESLGAPLGLVSAITSQSRLTLTFGGRSGHAGTTPMGARRDALGGAAAFVLLAEAEALATPGLVATVGQIAALPGSANVIPGRVTLSLDVRHPDAAVRRAAVERMLAAGAAEAARRRLEMEATPVFEHAAVPCDAALSAVLRTALGAMGLAAPSLVSGAGHDAQVLAARWPVAMLFLRSPGGISHHPDEAVLPGDVALAVGAMVDFLERLGGQRSGPAADDATGGASRGV